MKRAVTYPFDPAQVEVYPVGALASIITTARVVRYRRLITVTAGRPGPFVRPQLARMLHTFRDHWRRQSFWNGYLAEPVWGEQGPSWTRCGTGWTRRRALASLAREVSR